MKKFTHKEILEFAQKTVRANEKMKWDQVFFGILILAGLSCLIWILHEQSEKLGTKLFMDIHFCKGVAFGIMFMMMAILGGLGLIRVFILNRGLEHQALKRLIELEKQNEGQQKDFADAQKGGGKS